jgi:hypothetical protein
MSKKSVNKIANTSSTLAVLLEKLQNRITSTFKRVTDVEDRLDLVEAVLPYGPGDGTRLASQDSVYELDKKVDAITTNAAKGFVEQKQAIADNATGTSYALDALKDSSQRALDNVAKDIKAASDCAQRHNARISKLEGDKDQTALQLVGVRLQQVAFDDRLARLESKNQPAPTASLTRELKELLKRFGYEISAITVSKNEYDVIPSLISPAYKIQNIEIKASGSKKL